MCKSDMGYQQSNRKQKISFLDAKENGRKLEQEVMTEEEDGVEKIYKYKMGVSITSSY